MRTPHESAIYHSDRDISLWPRNAKYAGNPQNIDIILTICGPILFNICARLAII